ncbi:MAG TPA: hypothetical protein VKE27_01380 [Candidatus Dormibacteraeota bacterium]|nr:hypothetical protein [Candidatus Dormibacteraeota bacterium]
MREQVSGTDGETAWWDRVLAGQAGTQHPVFGDQLKVRLSDGKLILAGELANRRERDEVIRQAKARLGHGVHEIDVSRLRYRTHPERRGVLDQTLIAAFQHRDTADLARKFILEHSHVRPKHIEIVEKQPGRLQQLAPGFEQAARKRLERGDALLVIRADEVDAFDFRQLLEEDTRSVWTVAAPPEVTTAAKAG